MDEMSSPRPLPDIQADIATTTLLLARLAARSAAAPASPEGTASSPTSTPGLSRAAIAAKWGVDYGQVATVLHKAGRNERTRRALGLSDSQRTDYQRLLRQGVRSMIARAIALRGP